MSERATIIKNLLAQALEAEPGQKISESDIDQILYICRVGCGEKAPAGPENIYRICHAVARQYGLYEAMRAMMKRKWQAESMREMPLKALQELFYYMRGLERLKKGF